MLILYIVVFIGGLCLGSFFNVFVLRYGVKPGLVSGRSQCPDCQRELAWYDLVPLVSYVLLKGRCRYCSQKISYRYPIVELITGVMMLTLVAIRWPNISYELIIDIILIGGFLLILLFDLKHFIIPDVVVFLLIIVQTVIIFVNQPEQLIFQLGWSFLYAGFFGIVYLVSKGAWMGFGDVKLVFLLGLIAGYPMGFWLIAFSVWTAAIFGIFLVLLKKAGPKTALPFGSFLAFFLILFLIFKYDIEKILPILYSII